MKIDKKQIQRIADLARLELSDDELEKYRNQISDILVYIDQLQEVNTDNVEPTAQITGLENVLREDEICEWDKEESEKALNQAPELKNNQVKVKRVL